MAGHLYRVDTQRAANSQIWFRFIMQEDGVPQIKIYTVGGALVKDIDGLGDRPEGTYASRSRAVFWNKRNTAGNLVAAGQYFAQLLIDSVIQDVLRFAL